MTPEEKLLEALKAYPYRKKLITDRKDNSHMDQLELRITLLEEMLERMVDVAVAYAKESGQ